MSIVVRSVGLSSDWHFRNNQQRCIDNDNSIAVERGITLDLGFSALDLEPPDGHPKDEKLQLTFVDCPGHASLIRTIIGGEYKTTYQKCQ